MNDRLEKVEIPSNNFKQKLDANSKVLFSGVFGSGKTTFLNDFFLNNSDYQAIHLYPVNYSVVSNKDIFELIKYDILFQLLGKISKEDFEKVEIPYHLTLFAYLTSNQALESKADFFASFLSFAGKYGNAALKVYGQIKRMKTDLLDYHKKFQQDNFKSLEEYLEVPVNETGHVYEEDFYTELIRILLEKLKEKGEKKKTTVLVVDDLDRLDPEHIFRILNVFSCHFDFRGVDNDNKFDFDKVLLVCDYKNIESVFSHKYGSDADFSGYIDKFYSSIYWYSSSEYLTVIVGEYLKSISLDVGYDLFTFNQKVGEQIKYILQNLTKNNLLTFREILKYNKTFKLSTSKNIIRNKVISNSILTDYNFNASIVIYFLLNFFKNDSSLLYKLDRVRKLDIDYAEDYSLIVKSDAIAELLIFLNSEKLIVDRLRRFEPFIEEIEFKDYTFKCEIVTKKHNIIESRCSGVSKKNKDYKLAEISYFDILYEVVLFYRKIIK
ncbi:KAP-like P-loop domain-containing protein [Cellulophaga sp. RHA_52]|uniref:P-loop NTPase fold protein n=1 Tax=Cellulophaga sp. RHA_52 TaxID=1250036 RepID=UPI00119C61B0|nr:P-loop NTPase fold protein [Cellulophaga sp. RHA_52]TVZ07762.1 KAP-like P-loop domain-containing protein [Cellulophaga sp. RHA_52]